MELIKKTFLMRVKKEEIDMKKNVLILMVLVMGVGSSIQAKKPELQAAQAQEKSLSDRRAQLQEELKAAQEAEKSAYYWAHYYPDVWSNYCNSCYNVVQDLNYAHSNNKNIVVVFHGLAPFVFPLEGYRKHPSDEFLTYMQSQCSDACCPKWFERNVQPWVDAYKKVERLEAELAKLN